MNSAREAILDRVRTALRTPSDNHVRGEPRPLDRTDHTRSFTSLTPQVPADRAGQIERFLQLSQTLRTTVCRCSTMKDARDTLAQIARDEKWSSIGVHDHPLVMKASKRLDLKRVDTTVGYQKHDLATVDAGITACEALIAQTGSILITTRSSGGRALSVLPPHHVVIATVDQMLPDLAAGYRLLHERYASPGATASPQASSAAVSDTQTWPSFTTLITGPSRTGDIERILVLGAHGPKQLTVLLIEDE